MKRQFLILCFVCALGLSLVGFATDTAAYTVTFDSLDPMEIYDSSMNPDPPYPGDCFDCYFEIINNTGTTWTDFHLEAWGMLGSVWFPKFDGGNPTGGFDGVPYEGPGTYTMPDIKTIDIVNLAIADGEKLIFTLDFDMFEEIFGKVIARPTVDGGTGPDPDSAVPEPGTIFLLGTGGLALFALGRRRLKK